MTRPVSAPTLSETPVVIDCWAASTPAPRGEAGLSAKSDRASGVRTSLFKMPVKLSQRKTPHSARRVAVRLFTRPVENPPHRYQIPGLNTCSRSSRKCRPIIGRPRNHWASGVTQESSTLALHHHCTVNWLSEQQPGQVPCSGVAVCAFGSV